MVVLVTSPELKPLGEGGDVYGEEMVGGEPTPGQGEGPQKKSTLPTPRSWTSSLPNWT